MFVSVIWLLLPSIVALECNGLATRGLRHNSIGVTRMCPSMALLLRYVTVPGLNFLIRCIYLHLIIHFLQITSMSHLGWSLSECHTLVWEDSPPLSSPYSLQPFCYHTRNALSSLLSSPMSLSPMMAFPTLLAPRHSVLWATSFFWERSCEGAWPWLTKVF